MASNNSNSLSTRTKSGSVANLMPAQKHMTQGQSCLIAAQTDAEAVSAWLMKYEKSVQTWRAYQRQARIFLAWCQQHHLTFIEIGQQQMQAYAAFLQDPQPRGQWCQGQGQGKRGWRPFKAGLSAKSIQQALTILGSLFKFLVAAGYLDRNPLRLIHFQPTHAQTTHYYSVLERMPTPEEWQLMMKTIRHWPNEQERLRLRLVFSLLFYTGLRISELASLSWQSFRKTPQGWSLFVVGKGNKPRDIPVEALLSELVSYRLSVGLSALPKTNETSPVICDLRGDKGLSARQLFNLVKAVSTKAAQLEGLDKTTTMRLKKFSPHWIRHLCPSLMVKAGVSAPYVQQLLGHASPQTTAIYVHLFNDERREAVKTLDMDRVWG